MSVIRFASLAWCGLNRILRASTERLGSATRLEVPVVSIGNLQAGGSGKTPVTIEIARELKNRGKTVWILTRGYRSQLEDSYGVLAGMTHTSPMSDFGDEAPLLAEHSGAIVIVGSSRVENYRRYRATGAQCDIVLLDDGLQQFGIEKNLDIICVTDAKPDRVFFRESRTNGYGKREWVIETKGRAPFALPEGRSSRIELRTQIGSSARGKRGWLITGIGSPAHLIANLEHEGIFLEEKTILPDHHEFAEEEVSKWLEMARVRGLTIFMTEKDALKWRPLAQLEVYDVAVVGYECEWISGKDELFQTLWKECFNSPYSP